jgi:hypothetical protein
VRALVQRVTGARVRVDGDVVGEIGPGLCVLVGVTHDDDGTTAEKLAAKVWNLRVFADADGQMNLPVGSVGGSARMSPPGGSGPIWPSSWSTTGRSRCCWKPDYGSRRAGILMSP